MKRFILLALGLFLLAMALTGGVIVYAQAHNSGNPLLDYGYEVCDGQPCFMGVMPGMDWTTALATFKARGLDITSGFTTSARINGNLVVITPTKGNKQVAEIFLQLEWLKY